MLGHSVPDAPKQNYAFDDTWLSKKHLLKYLWQNIPLDISSLHFKLSPKTKIEKMIPEF